MFNWWENIVDKLVYNFWGMNPESAIGSATHFFYLRYN